MSKLKIFIIIILLILSFILTFIFIIPNLTGHNIKYGNYEGRIPSNSWMSNLNDNILLTNINLPGTHDSATQFVDLAFFSKCQGTDIKTQLKNGFRYLDIRLGIQESDPSPDKNTFDQAKQKLMLMHGFTKCRKSFSIQAEILYLEHILKMCYEFLIENPTETIVFTVKQEYGNHSVQEFHKALKKYIAENPNMWYTENTIPILKKIRGKIVLALRYEVKNENYGLNFVWKNQSDRKTASSPYEQNLQSNGLNLFVQDRYKYNADNKWKAFIETLKNAEQENKISSNLFINFLSTNGTFAYGHPITYARKLNKKLFNYNFSELKKIGWIVVDFGTQELAEKIYMTNF